MGVYTCISVQIRQERIRFYFSNIFYYIYYQLSIRNILYVEMTLLQKQEFCVIQRDVKVPFSPLVGIPLITLVVIGILSNIIREALLTLTILLSSRPTIDVCLVFMNLVLYYKTIKLGLNIRIQNIYPNELIANYLWNYLRNPEYYIRVYYSS